MLLTQEGGGGGKEHKRAVGEKQWENAKQTKNSHLFIIDLLLFLSVSLLLSLLPTVFPFLLPPGHPADLAVVDPVLAGVRVTVAVSVGGPLLLLGGGPRLRRRPLGLRVRRGALVPVESLVLRRGLLLGLLGGCELGLVGVPLGALGFFGLGELVWRERGGEGLGLVEGGKGGEVGVEEDFFVFFFLNADTALFSDRPRRSSVSLSSNRP